MGARRPRCTVPSWASRSVGLASPSPLLHTRSLGVRAPGATCALQPCGDHQGAPDLCLAWAGGRAYRVGLSSLACTFFSFGRGNRLSRLFSHPSGGRSPPPPSPTSPRVSAFQPSASITIHGPAVPVLCLEQGHENPAHPRPRAVAVLASRNSGTILHLLQAGTLRGKQNPSVSALSKRSRGPLDGLGRTRGQES